MTQDSPPTPPPGTPPPQPPVPSPPPMSPVEGVRIAYTQRSETDYVFDFWSALGWSILTCGIYGFYVLYQLVRRSRDHHRRRLEQLQAAYDLAWARASAQGLAEELRPQFERMGPSFAAMRQLAGEFRDPIVWVVLDVVAGGIVNIIAYILLDQDFVKHDYHEGAIETELSQIFTRLGTPIPPPNPARLHQPHNYVGRVVVTLVTCGVYGLWWLYNMMTELNEHFVENWAWEDALAAAVRAE